MKKAQASVATESKAVPPTPVIDDFPKDESLSSTSTEEDQEYCALPAPSSFPPKIPTSTVTTEVPASSSGNFQGARPRVSTSAAGSGRHKKALPHHSTRD